MFFASRDRINEVRDRQRAISETSALNTFAVGTPDTPRWAPLAYRDNLDMVRAMRHLADRGQLNPAQARWYKGPGEQQ